MFALIERRRAVRDQHCGALGGDKMRAQFSRRGVISVCVLELISFDPWCPFFGFLKSSVMEGRDCILTIATTVDDCNRDVSEAIARCVAVAPRSE